MRLPSTWQTAGAAACLAAAILQGLPAGAETRAPLFTADQDACFGRVYDASHLGRHPDQKVTSIHIFRSLSERPEAENWQQNQRSEAIKRFRETGEASAVALTFRSVSQHACHRNVRAKPH